MEHKPVQLPDKASFHVSWLMAHEIKNMAVQRYGQKFTDLKIRSMTPIFCSRETNSFGCKVAGMHRVDHALPVRIHDKEDSK